MQQTPAPQPNNDKNPGKQALTPANSAQEESLGEELTNVTPKIQKQALKVTPTNILYLQRIIGNQAVQRMLFKKPVPALAANPGGVIQREITITNSGKNDVGYYDKDVVIGSDTAPGLYLILKQSRFKENAATIVDILNKWATTKSITYGTWMEAAEAALKEFNSTKNTTPTAFTTTVTQPLPSSLPSSSSSSQTRSNNNNNNNVLDQDNDSDQGNDSDQDSDDDKSGYYVENTLYGSGKHGINWKEAKSRAKMDNKPQGKFGSEADVNYLIKCAKVLKQGAGFFELPASHTCVVYTIAGDIVAAEIVFLKIYPNGKIHGYPLLKADKKDKKPIQNAVN